jgi:hypothetical protein
MNEIFKKNNHDKEKKMLAKRKRIETQFLNNVKRWNCKKKNKKGKKNNPS